MTPGEIQTLTCTDVEDNAVQPTPGQSAAEPRLVEPYAALPSAMAEAIHAVARNFDEARCACGEPIGWGVNDDGYPAVMRFDSFTVVMNVDDQRAWAVCENCACALDADATPMRKVH